MMKIFLITLLFAVSGQAREVEFSWAPMPTAMKYEIQVAMTPKFEKVVTQSQMDKPNFVMNTQVGRYYYRVRAIDLKGHPGRWSQPATVLVEPYAPELIAPAANYETQYFEVLPEIEFQWKSAQEQMNYEILISKASGQKVLEQSTKDFNFKTTKLPEGEYTWKVRSAANQISSVYTEARKFTIVKKPLKPPKLIKPTKDGLTAAYRPVDFEWEQDPATKYTDFFLEKTKSTSPDGKIFKTKLLNLKKANHQDPYEEPGEYKWWVVTKEATNTPGVASDVQNFELRNDVLTKGNYELEFSLSPVNDLYTTTSARQNGGTSLVAQQSTGTGTFVGFHAGYYLTESIGLFMSQRTARMDVENFSGLFNETDFQFRLRFGSKGFNQEFILGYRLMDQLEAENTPAVMTTNVTEVGGLFGTRLTATIIPAIRTQFSIFYYKPLINIDGISNWVSDTYGGSLVVKWNFMYQFWLGYRFSMERINNSFTTPGQAPSVTSSWTQYRLEPLFFSLSFEH